MPLSPLQIPPMGECFICCQILMTWYEFPLIREQTSNLLPIKECLSFVCKNVLIWNILIYCCWFYCRLPTELNIFPLIREQISNLLPIRECFSFVCKYVSIWNILTYGCWFYCQLPTQFNFLSEFGTPSMPKNPTFLWINVIWNSFHSFAHVDVFNYRTQWVISHFIILFWRLKRYLKADIELMQPLMFLK